MERRTENGTTNAHGNSNAPFRLMEIYGTLAIVLTALRWDVEAEISQIETWIDGGVRLSVLFRTVSTTTPLVPVSAFQRPAVGPPRPRLEPDEISVGLVLRASRSDLETLVDNLSLTTETNPIRFEHTFANRGRVWIVPASPEGVA